MTPIIRPIPHHSTPMTEYEKEQAYYAMRDAENRALARRNSWVFVRLAALMRTLRAAAAVRASRRIAPTRRVRITSLR